MDQSRTSSLLFRSSTAHLLLRPCSHSTGGHPQCSSGWPPRCTPSWNACPHTLEEDAEPNEDLTGNDFTCSHDATTAFQELLTIIDSNTKELPNVLSTKHYAALTQLPLTYPWARLVLDLKELLISFDRHLITCLIANHVQGNAAPHPGTVLSSFLQHLAAHSAYHSPPRYRWRTSFSSPPLNLRTWILARTPELCLHQIRHLSWLW